MPLLEVLGGASAVVSIIKSANEVRTALSTTPSIGASSFETTLNYWGAMLFEARVGCERARLMPYRAAETRVYYAPFSFQVIDAVLPVFFKAAPAPRMLEMTTRLISRLRRIYHFQRIGKPASEWSQLDFAHVVEIGFAKDLMSKNGHGEFNEVLAVGQAVARAYFEYDPNQSVAHIFPEPIDVLSPVDEQLL